MNYIDLKNKIITEIDLLSESDRAIPLKVHTSVANSIKDYFLTNLKIKGVYSGTLPGGGSDPKNGEYEWSVKIMVLTGADLEAAANLEVGSFNSWRDTLETSFKGVTFLGEDNGSTPTITTSVPALLTLADLSLLTYESMRSVYAGLTPEQILQVDCQDLSMAFMCNKIVNSVIGKNLTPPASAATSTSGGNGTVTFNITF